MDMHFDGVIFQTHAAELARRLGHPHPPFAVIDVRGQGEWAAGHIPGSLPATPATLERGLPDGTTSQTEFFVVGSDPTDPAPRAASLELERLGATRRVELPGGMAEWTALGLPVERAPA